MSIFKKVDYEDEALSVDAFADDVTTIEDIGTDLGTDEIDTASDSIDEVINDVVNEEIESSEITSEINEDLVKEFLKNKYGAEFETLEDLVKPKENSGKKIPEDVEKYLDYKEKTGRSYADFMETQKDWSNEDPNYVLKKYLSEKNPYLDTDEVNEEFEEKFIYDVDYDDDKDIKTKKREFKKTLSEALNYFENQKSQYAVARFDESVIPEDYKVAKTTLDNLQIQQEQSLKTQAKQSENFINLTDNLFTSDFKGFDFNVSGNKLNYNVADVAQVKESQKDISNFFNQFVDVETGLLKNAGGYHKALHTAMNADKIAEHFYELGKADAIKNEVSNSKNIDMGQKEVGSTGVGSSPKMFKIL